MQTGDEVDAKYNSSGGGDVAGGWKFLVVGGCVTNDVEMVGGTELKPKLR